MKKALNGSLTIDHAIRQDAIQNANKESPTSSAELGGEIPNDIGKISATNSLQHRQEFLQALPCWYVSYWSMREGNTEIEGTAG
jgi:hypothetical protein